MDTIKKWLLNVFISKAVPSFVRAGIAAFGVVMAAHQGLLTSMGIMSSANSHQIIINLDKLSDWLIFAGPGGITALLAICQHHVIAIAKGQSHTGA